MTAFFSLQQGRRLCPDLRTIPYEFEKYVIILFTVFITHHEVRYKQLSLRFYTILMRHADDIQAVSVDEALIEVTTSVSRCAIRPSSLTFPNDPARSLAEQIRSEVRDATGCEGTSHGQRQMTLADKSRSQHWYRREHTTCPHCHA